MSRFSPRRPGWQLLGKRFVKLLLVLTPIPLLWWVFRQVPFEQVWAILQQLTFTQIVLWLSVNFAIVFLMTGRWWLILRTLRHSLPYWTLTRYRLASFAVSYFTPGPQFGGEPLQVLALRQRHQVSGTLGTASVGLDKLLDLIANFSFLAFGLAVALAGTWLPNEWRCIGLIAAFSLLSFPLAYLILMLKGQQPLNQLMDHLPSSVTGNWLGNTLRAVEIKMSGFCVQHPRTVLQATLVSLSIWAGMVLEYWLLTHFLGLRLSLVQALSALVAARLAFLTPLPGGFGVLEVSQVLALQTLGLDSSYGISLALLIRLRDLLLGAIGMVSALSLLGARQVFGSRDPKDV